MGMLGNQIAAGQALTIANDSFNGDGSTVAFTLSQTVGSVNDIEVLVDNVQQSPYDGSYSVSGTTLTFSGAPSAGTNNVYVIYNASRHITTQQIIPDDGSVHSSKIATGAVVANIGYTPLSAASDIPYANMPAGSVLQVVNNPLPVGTLVYTANNLSWISISESDTAVTSKSTNSKWIVNFTGLAACRQAKPMSFDIWYSIDGGSNWIDMSGNRDEQNHAGSGLGLTGYWQTGGTDDWYPLSITVTGVISVNIGSNIKFRLAMRNGGPSTDVANTSNCVGHGDYTMQMLVQEIGQ